MQQLLVLRINLTDKLVNGVTLFCVSIFVDFRETPRGSFISLYQKINQWRSISFSAYTRSDVQVGCAQTVVSYDTFRTRASRICMRVDFYVSRFNIYQIYEWWQRIVYTTCARKNNKYIYRAKFQTAARPNFIPVTS